jgi:hypothetical protein
MTYGRFLGKDSVARNPRTFLFIVASQGEGRKSYWLPGARKLWREFVSTYAAHLLGWFGCLLAFWGFFFVFVCLVLVLVFGFLVFWFCFVFWFLFLF